MNISKEFALKSNNKHYSSQNSSLEITESMDKKQNKNPRKKKKKNTKNTPNQTKKKSPNLNISVHFFIILNIISVKTYSFSTLYVCIVSQRTHYDSTDMGKEKLQKLKLFNRLFSGYDVSKVCKMILWKVNRVEKNSRCKCSSISQSHFHNYCNHKERFS